MKKLIVSLILLVFLIISFMYNYSYARTDLGLGELNQYVSDSEISETISNRMGTILGIIQTIGTVLSVAILVVLGIKYMAGSVEEKADYKSSMIPYIVGAALVFTGTYIPQLIYDLTHQVVK